MPTRITNFLHDSVVAPGSAPALGTAFDAADVHVHDMQKDLPSFQKDKRNYRGIVGGIFIKLTSASSPSATKITVRLCADAAGDETLVPDTEAELVAGITDANTQCAAFSVSLPLFQVPPTQPPSNRVAPSARIEERARGSRASQLQRGRPVSRRSTHKQSKATG